MSFVAGLFTGALLILGMALTAASCHRARHDFRAAGKDGGER